MTLKELRERANLTRAQVAKKLNVGPSCVSHWELCDWGPTRKYHKALARLYGVTEQKIKTLVDAIAAEKKEGS